MLEQGLLNSHREQKFRTLADSLPDFISWVDREQRILYINPAIEQMGGIPAEFFVGRTLDEMGLAPARILQWRQLINQVFQTGKSAFEQIEMAGPHGPRYLHAQALPEFGPDGTVKGAITVVRDITEQKLALDRQLEREHNRQLRLQMAELERLNRLKDDFLSAVSHELRTPLTNMQLAIRLLQKSNCSEQQANYLRILAQECERETALIEDLLDLQRHKRSQYEPLLVQEWLPQIALPFQSRAQQRQQQLQVEVAPQLPMLYTDRSSLERIVVELINNACKYTPPGGQIRVRATAEPAGLLFSVINTGVEIAPEHREQIFDKFYRIPEGDPWREGGTGLGLALVRKLCEKLGAYIFVASDHGQTAFTVTLPFAE